MQYQPSLFHAREPRLTSHWSLDGSGSLEPEVLERMRLALSSRYGVVFDSAGFNLYRDGRDGVAWHRDRIRQDIREPVVPLVSLGEPRRLARAGPRMSVAFRSGLTYAGTLRAPPA